MTRRRSGLDGERAKRRVHDAPRRAERARGEIARREIALAAEPYRDELPVFYRTALKVGIVPDPPAVFTEPTSVLPTVRPGRSLLGLNDDEEPNR